jgi:hypothetical protein
MAGLHLMSPKMHNFTIINMFIIAHIYRMYFLPIEPLSLISLSATYRKTLINKINIQHIEFLFN